MYKNLFLILNLVICPENDKYRNVHYKIHSDLSHRTKLDSETLVVYTCVKSVQQNSYKHLF